MRTARRKFPQGGAKSYKYRASPKTYHNGVDWLRTRERIKLPVMKVLS
jgi:hypothetical protein